MHHVGSALRVLAAVVLATFLLPPPASATHEGKPHWGAWFKQRPSGDSAAAAIERGRKVFNELGCAGCHPRGGTIGGRARNVLGKLSPRPIPDLHGAARHFPRVATGMKKLVTLGQMNDV
ncbi:MAG: hypothetical protein ACE5LU_27715 [Anaerolineae bacterium]